MVIPAEGEASPREARRRLNFDGALDLEVVAFLLLFGCHFSEQNQKRSFLSACPKKSRIGTMAVWMISEIMVAMMKRTFLYFCYSYSRRMPTCMEVRRSCAILI
jgi:hypothetical protein